jgi:hypothetical protein
MKTKSLILSAAMLFSSVLLSAAPAGAPAAAAPQNPAQADPRPADQKEVIVYVTDTGKKYHREGCRSLSKSKIPKSLKEASKTYSPCSVCNPPAAS